MKLKIFGVLLTCALAYACGRDVGSPAAPEALQAGGNGVVRALGYEPSPTPCPSPTPTPKPTPTPTPPPPSGDGCSPGYWKNHLTHFYAVCGDVDGWSCSQLLTALTCRGSDASCRRNEAAGALNVVSGCTETD